MINIQDYRKFTRVELINELVSIVDELCDIIEEEGFIKAGKGNSPEKYVVSAKRDVLTERKYLLGRLIDNAH